MEEFISSNQNSAESSNIPNISNKNIEIFDENINNLTYALNKTTENIRKHMKNEDVSLIELTDSIEKMEELLRNIRKNSNIQTDEKYQKRYRSSRSTSRCSSYKRARIDSPCRNDKKSRNRSCSRSPSSNRSFNRRASSNRSFSGSARSDRSFNRYESKKDSNSKRYKKYRRNEPFPSSSKSSRRNSYDRNNQYKKYNRENSYYEEYYQNYPPMRPMTNTEIQKHNSRIRSALQAFNVIMSILLEN